MDHRDVIPEDVKRFILLGIPSVPYLEAVLLLRSDPSRAWDHKQVAGRLYLSEKAAQTLLDELREGGVVTDNADGTSSVYKPQSPALDIMIGRLAEIYPRNLIAVTNLIHGKSANRRAQQFADAFVLRKEAT